MGHKKHGHAAVASAAVLIIILILLALLLWKSSKETEEDHPELEDPLSSYTAQLLSETEAAGSVSEDTESSEVSLPSSEELPAETSSLASSGTVPGEEGSDMPLFETESEEETELLPDHQIIFVGDSRTVGLQNAMKKAGISDRCVYIGKVGEGCSWFRQEGLQQMAEAVSLCPDAPVVLNLGVNDPDQISQYLDSYSSMINEFPDTDFYFLSVNPIDTVKMREYGFSEQSLELITDESIAKLNRAVRERWPKQYLDSNGFLTGAGFETVDGIHYTGSTYLSIHDFVVRQLFTAGIPRS